MNKTIWKVQVSKSFLFSLGQRKLFIIKTSAFRIFLPLSETLSLLWSVSKCAPFSSSRIRILEKEYDDALEIVEVNFYFSQNSLKLPKDYFMRANNIYFYKHIYDYQFSFIVKKYEFRICSNISFCNPAKILIIHCFNYFMQMLKCSFSLLNT